MNETHITEEYIGLNGLVSEEYINSDELIGDVKQFLSKFYTWDEDCEEFADTPKPEYREYRITVKREDECCDTAYVFILHAKVYLPTDADAKELADILDGKVTSGLNADGKLYRITYSKTISIRANSPEEARNIFDIMDMADTDRMAELARVVSVEEQY